MGQAYKCDVCDALFEKADLTMAKGLVGRTSRYRAIELCVQAFAKPSGNGVDVCQDCIDRAILDRAAELKAARKSRKGW